MLHAFMLQSLLAFPEAFLSTTSPWYCLSAQGSRLTTFDPKSTSVDENVNVGFSPIPVTGTRSP